MSCGQTTGRCRWPGSAPVGRGDGVLVRCSEHGTQTARVSGKRSEFDNRGLPPIGVCPHRAPRRGAKRRPGLNTGRWRWTDLFGQLLPARRRVFHILQTISFLVIFLPGTSSCPKPCRPHGKDAEVERTSPRMGPFPVRASLLTFRGRILTPRESRRGAWGERSAKSLTGLLRARGHCPARSAISRQPRSGRPRSALSRTSERLSGPLQDLSGSSQHLAESSPVV